MSSSLNLSCQTFTDAISYCRRFKKIEAHTLGSLEKYDEAKHILDILIHYNTIENINLRTSALSNHKRALMLSGNPVDADELYTLITGYKELHVLMVSRLPMLLQTPTAYP